MNRPFTLPVLLLLLASTRALIAQQGAIVPLDTVWLEQTETSYLAQPVDLAADPAGGFLVLDGQVPQVLSYDARGDLRRVIGSAGEGPGEFRDATAIVLLGDTLGVLATEPAALIFYDPATGGHLGQVRLEGYAHGATAYGATLWLETRSFERRTGLARLTPPYDQAEHLAPLPDEFQRSGQGLGPLAGIFPGASVVPAGDRWLVGYQPMDHLLVLDSGGSVVDTIRIPIVRRRGVPDDPEAALIAAMRESYPKVFTVLSVLQGLHRLPGGEIAAVHHDYAEVQTLEDLPPASRVYVSLLFADLREACPDLEVPLDPEAEPVVSFAGDTLLVLQQRLEPDLSASAFIARHRLRPAGCGWTPVGGGVPTARPSASPDPPPSP